MDTIYDRLLHLPIQFFADQGTGEKAQEAAEPAPNNPDNYILEDVDNPGDDPGPEGETGEKGEGTAKPPQQQQSAEDNSRYAAARRQAEAQMKAEREELQRLKDQNERLAKSRGFNSFDELLAAVQAEEREAQRQQYIQQHGIDPDAIKPLIDQAVNQHPAVQQAQEQKLQSFIASEVQELSKRFPDAGIQSLEDLAGRPDVLDLWRKGIPLADAFAVKNIDRITAQRSAAAKQAAINSVNGRKHLQASGSNAGNDIVVPRDVLEAYREMNPDATVEEIKRHYAIHHFS